MSRFVVTGAAGFIGSNLAFKLSDLGHDLVLVDDFENGALSKKLFSIPATEVINHYNFLDWLNNNKDIDGVFHLGACSNTQEWNGNFLLKNNFEFTKSLFHKCQNNEIRLVYASSAAVYGLGLNGFAEIPQCEEPINFYAYSKLLFDNYLRNQLHKEQSNVVGLRYFNVYGKYEDHKENMASPVHKFTVDALSKGTISVFSDTPTHKKENHLRDFISVDDCVDLNLYMMFNPRISGIFNCGTGRVHSFIQVANLIKKCLEEHSVMVKIQEIPMPDQLTDSYQYYTKADTERVRSAGWEREFISLEQGIKEFVEYKIS